MTVLGPSDPRWDDTLRGTAHDLHHHRGYHALARWNGEGEPELAPNCRALKSTAPAGMVTISEAMGNWRTAVPLVGGTMPPTQFAPFEKSALGPLGIQVKVWARTAETTAQKRVVPARS